MKKILSIFLMVILPFTSLLAQRLLPNQRGLQVSAGMFSNDRPKDNYFVNLELTQNHRKGSYHFFSAEYQRRTAFYIDNPKAVAVISLLITISFCYRTGPR